MQGMKVLRLDIAHLDGVELREKLAGGVAVELRIARFDAQEVAIARRGREARHVEDRMVGLGKAVQDEDTRHRGEDGAEDRALEGDGDESGPRVERPPADVERVLDDGDPVLEK